MSAAAVMHCPSCQAENLTSARTCFACGAPLEPGLAGLQIGAIFASRFEILGSLGRGGMGMVYRAWDRELKETVAIKVLRPDVARESRRVERRFRAEIRLARRVRHRNVCSMYGDGEDRGLRYICMELVAGENLARVTRGAGGLARDDAWEVVLQVADGLQAIHQAGVVHRDLKTANLMRDPEGVVRVMDFGIAKHLVGAASGHTVTASGVLMGTPEYMSPEQLRGEPTDFRSDLYSFGIVIYELFTGSLPFRGDTPVATILRQLQDAPNLDVPRLPPALGPVLRCALAKSPGGRFATAGELADALRDARATPSGRVTSFGNRVLPDGALVTDETRTLPPSRERAPILRIAAGLAGVTALAAHLLDAGGVAGAAPLLLPSPATIDSESIRPSFPAPRPLSSRPPASRPYVYSPPVAIPDLSPRPSPSPEPAMAEPVVVLPPTNNTVAVEPHRVYEEEEVDVPPRRIQGASAPYPRWGPQLSRGQRVSITASFVVNEEGDVTDIQVEKGGGALEAVLVEISRWKFEPGLKDGIPVKVRLVVKHTFIGG
jgi:serine/threonine protein kinase